MSQARVAMSVASLGLASCLAPTLPVPPPSAPDITVSDTEGLVVVFAAKGSADPSGEVSVYNATLATACKVDCAPGRFGKPNIDGSWRIIIPAKKGDLILVWQEVGGLRSQSIEVIAP